MNNDDIIKKALSDDLDDEIARYEALPDEKINPTLKEKIYKKINKKERKDPAPIKIISAAACAALIFGGAFAAYSLNKNKMAAGSSEENSGVVLLPSDSRPKPIKLSERYVISAASLNDYNITDRSMSDGQITVYTSKDMKKAMVLIAAKSTEENTENDPFDEYFSVYDKHDENSESWDLTPEFFGGVEGKINEILHETDYFELDDGTKVSLNHFFRTNSLDDFCFDWQRGSEQFALYTRNIPPSEGLEMVSSVEKRFVVE